MSENRDLNKLALAVIEKMASETDEGSELHGKLLMAAELLDPSEPEVTQAMTEAADTYLTEGEALQPVQG